MYSAQDILNGIQNPSLIRNEIHNQYTRIYDTVINKMKEREQLDNDSRYGLVLNWGLHQRGEWTVAEYPYFINGFLNRFDPVILTSQSIYEAKASKIDNIFAFGARNKKGPTLEYLDEDHTVLLFASDPNNKPEWLYEYIHRNSVDRVLSPVYNPFFDWVPHLDEQMLEFFPWAVPEQFIINPEEIQYRGNDKIHLTGASGNEVYEMRDWCRQQEFVVDYNTSGHQNRVFSHSEYYQWLRKFDCMVATGSLKPRWQYLFGKYFEIPAAGNLLFAQYSADLNKAGFNDENCVIFDSKDSFKSNVNSYVENPEIYMNTRKRGAELIKEKHTVSDRLDTVDSLFSSL